MKYTKRTLKYMGMAAKDTDPVAQANAAIKVNEAEIEKLTGYIYEINMNLRPALLARKNAVAKAQQLFKGVNQHGKGPVSEALYNLNIRAENDQVAYDMLENASMMLSNAYRMLK